MPRILLIGELAKDTFIYGPCNRISPEAPVVVQSYHYTESNEGMAGNVRANLVALNPNVQIDFHHQEQDILKVRHVDEVSGQQLLRVDVGEDSFTPDFAQRVLESLRGKTYDALVISDYGKGLLSTQFMEALTLIFNEANAPIFMDTKAILGPWSQTVDFIKINEKEFKDQVKAGVSNPWKWCRNLIVTRGKQGMFLYNSQGEVTYHVPSMANKIVQVSGAGDTVLAALVTHYLKTQDIKASMEYASKAAAIAISKPGVAAVSWQELA